MDARDIAIARELRQAIEGVAEVVDFRVFGSRARGEAAADSDMDVYVEVESLTPQVSDAIEDLAWRIGFDNNTVIICIAHTREERERGTFGVSPLLREIEREGVAV